MDRTRLVITGASGQLGRRAAEIAVEAGCAERLILVTRSPGALASLAAHGAEVRFGDFDQPESLSEAFAGGKRLLLISATDLAKRVQQHEAAIQAAKAAGVEHVIYTSGLSPEPPNPAVVAPSHYATEQALLTSGMRWTVLRNSLYAEYQAAEAERAIASGSFVHNWGTGEIAHVSREDCAATAAAVLVAGGHEAAIWDVTGPETYTGADFAALCSELGGRPVEELALDDESFIATLAGDAADDDHRRYGAELVASFGRAIREGYLASLTDAVQRLTGRKPRPLREVLTEQRASSGSTSDPATRQ